MRLALFQIFIFLLSMFCLSIPVLAWNGNGHRIIAQVAYDNLNPNAKKQVKQLIPVLGQFYRIDSFTQAAVWADWIRADNVSAYDSWHYIVQSVHCSRKRKCARGSSHDIIWAINQSESVLSTPRRKKYHQGQVFQHSQFLFFLIHLVGDMTQPLHTATWYGPGYFYGDKGGNLYPIQSKVAKNLHQYWDKGAGLLAGKSMTERQVKAMARRIEQNFPEKAFDLNDLNPKDWAQKSLEVAREKVYIIAPNSKVSVIYQRQAQAVTEQQLALAGYRLAKVLNQLYG